MESTGYDSSFPIFRCSPEELMNAFASVVCPADERASRLRQKCREDFRVDTSDRADLTLSPADPYYNMPLGRPIMVPERVFRDTTGANRSTGKVGLYIQTCLETPDTLIQPLHEYMCKTTKVLGEISWWDLTARLQLITPIMAQVCLRGPDITFIDNSHLIQEYDFRDPSFQFVIRRGSVTVGVLASGCGLIQEKHMLEAVSARKRLVEQTGWDIPYVIVTTYFQWNYMYFGDDGKLAIDRSCLEILSSLPTWRSLGQVLVFENLTVSAQEPLQGVRVRAHGRPDFVIKRHYEIVCVVEVKSGEVWRGWGQNTVAALGIVTYLHTWNLLTSRGPIIEFENVVLPLVQGSPTPEMLDFVCSKISGALHAILE